MENDLSIDINLDETKKIKGLSTSLNIDNTSIDINIDLKEYDDEYRCRVHHTYHLFVLQQRVRQ